MEYPEKIPVRRKYDRSEKLITKAYVSQSGNRWIEVTTADISAGGIRFVHKGIDFEEKKEIYIKVEIISAFSEFTFKARAEVTRRDGVYYAARFIDLSKTDQILIDEIINFSHTKTNI